jgi:hypothetical protein
MDLDPDIESANRETEKRSVDLLDEKQVKPIADMVMAGIMGIETAQEMLGLDPAKNPTGSRTEASWAGPFARGDRGNAVCDDCAHFDDERNHCRVQRNETTFDTPVCRFFDSKTIPSETPSDQEGEVPEKTTACRECEK